jgi:hypothetical protein
VGGEEKKRQDKGIESGFQDHAAHLEKPRRQQREKRDAPRDFPPFCYTPAEQAQGKRGENANRSAEESRSQHTGTGAEINAGQQVDIDGILVIAERAKVEWPARTRFIVAGLGD